MSRGAGSFFLVLLSSLAGLLLDGLLHTKILFAILIPVAVAAALITGYQAAAERRSGVLTPWEEESGPPEPHRQPPAGTGPGGIPPYRTLSIPYTPQTQALSERVAQAANQMEGEGYALVSFSVTPSARAILVFRRMDTGDSPRDVPPL